MTVRSLILSLPFFSQYKLLTLLSFHPFFFFTITIKNVMDFVLCVVAASYRMRERDPRHRY